VVFDLDGTLTYPYLDFGRLRQQLGLGLFGEDILKWVSSLPEPRRRLALRTIEAFEQDGVRHARWNEGARETLGAVRRLGLSTAIVTRNSRASLDAVCRRLGVGADLLVAREDAPVKPHPESVRHVARRLAVSVETVLVVGDFRHDTEAGRAAGAMTALLTNGRPPWWSVEADIVIERLNDLLGYIV
jgi:HAD superfamily hydrolase (TIGR01509 family)